MLHKAGGIGTGRSRTASAPDPLHFPINLVSIAATGQLLPSASPTRSNRVKLKFGVVSTQRADFEPETRHHKSSATHPVAPSRTQSHHFSLYPLAFSLFSNPACRAGLSRQSLLAATNAKRTRVKASQSQSKPVKVGQTIFRAWTFGRASRHNYHILRVAMHNTPTNGVFPLRWT